MGLTRDRVPVAEAIEWATVAYCGAVVTFTGTVRDHNDDLTGHRTGITGIDYEAYDRHVEPRLGRIARAARAIWPGLGRVALFHRSGPVPVTEASVLVVVSAPHRSEAFIAARFCIDVLKESVPVWKREYGGDGTSGWVATGNRIDDVEAAAHRWCRDRNEEPAP
ncbi:molybdenum cofactor biosynthesis protein MoaE [Streptomyces griseorubiginosus]|uniref:molybdenum cofactor biosynthesis protein MoaE n=1 Tax=Streptomyces griseorubiginosus TaxID=67304 RepID=UPI001AD783A7|nr:molybdenum cofactor biosynthesis protein MoaE [Streptomyces griseorubiginosus]